MDRQWTPEQQGYIEPLHSTLKTEYIWPVESGNRLFNAYRVLHEMQGTAFALGGYIKSKERKVIQKHGSVPLLRTSYCLTAAYQQECNNASNRKTL